MPAEEPGSTEETSEEPMEVIRIPQNIDMRLKLTANEVRYTDMVFNDATGSPTRPQGTMVLNPIRSLLTLKLMP